MNLNPFDNKTDVRINRSQKRKQLVFSDKSIQNKHLKQENEGELEKQKEKKQEKQEGEEQQKEQKEVELFFEEDNLEDVIETIKDFDSLPLPIQSTYKLYFALLKLSSSVKNQVKIIDADMIEILIYVMEKNTKELVFFYPRMILYFFHQYFKSIWQLSAINL